MLAVKQYNLYDSFSESAVFKIDDVEGYYGGEIKYSPEDGITGSINCFCDQPLFACEDDMQPFYVRAAFSNGRYATLCKCTLEVKFRTFFSKTFYFTACYILNGICFHENIKIKGIDIIFNSWEKFYLGKMPKNRNIEYKNSPIKIVNNVLFCIRDIPEYGIFCNYVFSPDIDIHNRIQEIVQEALKNSGLCLDISTVKSTPLIHIDSEINFSDIDTYYRLIMKISQLIFVLTGVPTGPIHISVSGEHYFSDGHIEHGEHPFLFQPVIKKSIINNNYAYKGYIFQELFSYKDIEGVLPEIVKNFFVNYVTFFDIIDKITYNQKIGNSSKFTIASNIDAMSYLANIEGYQEKKKYDECIKNYAFEPLNLYIKNLFPDRKEKLGRAISNLRASVVHPGNQEYMDLFDKIIHKSPVIDNILALIPLNYLQESIGIPEELRCKFQKYWLDIYSSYEYVEYDRPDGEE